MSHAGDVVQSLKRHGSRRVQAMKNRRRCICDMKKMRSDSLGF
jgi:hypothetical protein